MNENRHTILARIERKVRDVHYYDDMREECPPAGPFAQHRIDRDVADIMEDVRSLLDAPREEGHADG